MPADLHKDLYNTLFESHLTYCISAWGNVPLSKLNELHKIQKKQMYVCFLTITNHIPTNLTPGCSSMKQENQ